MPALRNQEDGFHEDFGWSELSSTADFMLQAKVSEWMSVTDGVTGVIVYVQNIATNSHSSVVEYGSVLGKPCPHQVETPDGFSAGLDVFGERAEEETAALWQLIEPAVRWLFQYQRTLVEAQTFQNMPVIMYQAVLVEGRWVLVTANKALEDFIGEPLADFVGPNAPRLLTELVHPDDVENLRSAYEFTWHAANEMTLQYRLRRADGEYVSVSERLRFAQEPAFSRSMSIVWHRAIEQDNAEQQLLAFKNLEDFITNVSFETGREFLLRLCRRIEHEMNVSWVLLSASSRSGWWETWVISSSGILMPNFHYPAVSGLVNRSAVWNRTDIPGIDESVRKLLFGEQPIISYFPVSYRDEPIKVELCIGSTEKIEQVDEISQLLHLFGYRVLREINHVRSVEAQAEQNEILARQKGQLTKTVNTLGRLDTLEGEGQFIKAVNRYLNDTYSIHKIRCVYWRDIWYEVDIDVTEAEMFASSHQEFTEVRWTKYLEETRYRDHLTVERANKRVFWPLGLTSHGYMVLIVEFFRWLPDPEVLDFASNAIALTMQGLMQKQHLRQQAMRDSLTGLGNRVQLHEWMQALLPHYEESSLLLFDLNRFKEINDSFGHQFGDKLLQEIGPRISNAMTITHFISRLGGDEFALLLPDVTSDQADEAAVELHRLLADAYLIDGLQFQVEASIGIANFPAHGNDGHELLRCADVAMYEAKKSGRDSVRYSVQLDSSTPSRIAVLSELEHALIDEQLWVAYQPLMSTVTGRTGGFEALVRWQHPKYGALSPAEFISISEMGDGIRRITDFVLQDAMSRVRHWRTINAGIHVAVNISPRVLLDNRFPSNIESLLKQFELPGEAIILELTESTLLVDPIRAVDIIGALADLGIKVEIDDFGTGYSSLAYLKSLPISALKIDRSFIADILFDGQDEVIVSSMVNMAKSLGLQTVAEGVEDEATLMKIMRLGCDYIQGYYYSKPMPSNEASDWLKRNG